MIEPKPEKEILSTILNTSTKVTESTKKILIQANRFIGIKNNAIKVHAITYEQY